MCEFDEVSQYCNQSDAMVAVTFSGSIRSLDGCNFEHVMVAFELDPVKVEEAFLANETQTWKAFDEPDGKHVLGRDDGV